jgi:hypothetical protein
MWQKLTWLAILMVSLQQQHIPSWLVVLQQMRGERMSFMLHGLLLRQHCG